MSPRKDASSLLKIFLPLIVLVLFSAYPASYAVREGMREARAARSNGQPENMANSLRQVLEHEPWRVWLWEQIGGEELEAARLPEAVAAFRQAEAADSLSPQGRYLLGEAYFQQKQMLAAQETWQSLLQEGEDTPHAVAVRAYERLARLQREQGDFPAAVETLRAWHASEPASPRVAFELGLHLSVLEPAEALRLLVDAADQDSSLTPTVQKIRTAINLAGETGDQGYGWLVIGRALGSAGEWDLAAEAFRRAASVSPEYAEAWAFLGEALFQQGKDGQAELDRALALDGNSTLVRALLALQYRREEKYDLALDNLKSAADQEPSEPMWQIELGYTWAEKGDLPAALEHFETAARLAPGASIYWQYLANFSVAYGINVSDVGLPAARQAVVLSPDDPGALDAMGWTMVALADYASAERFLQQAVEKDATCTPALLHLGQLYLQEQKTDRAYSYLKRAALLSGEDSIGLIAKRLLLQYYGEGG